jgi:cell division septation protein DedD
MRFRPLLIAAGLSALLAGCGSENERLIPQDNADQLSALVADAGEQSAAGECDAASRTVRDAELQLDELPRRTSKQLKDNLSEWLAYLDEQIGEECEAEPEETVTPEPTPSATETPEPTATSTPTPTETPSPSPSPSPTTSPEPTVTVDPGTGGEQGPPEEPDESGGVSPEEDG